ncbi:hypothetical protein LLEC1_03537 [Akanthomyces lecanii]|uniref:Pyrroline-5-carboxylate reductase dimerisation domain-containing protein n=1 Tax=Cordyceps confragosa TaxID=2714763 RepID=A0A179IL86_CORDF|nr:hypothetical protein LLEC1_03537 [Akanthomyces lecanii]
MSSDSGFTLTVLGCGTMGIAIANGVLESLAAGVTPGDDVPASLPSKFIACVRSEKSAERVKKALAAHSSRVEVVRNDNVASVKKAQVVLLACKPYMVKDVLGVDGMADALKGKLLVSVCAGITAEAMEEAVYGQTMRGATGLVQSGEHPAVLRENVCTPGGCTIGGLLVLEDGGARGTISRAIREATVVASQLGKGVQNVNGTRPYLQ